MIEVESTPDSCTIAATYPGLRTTMTISNGDAVKLMETLAYNYGFGPEPQAKGKDPLDEALEEAGHQVGVPQKRKSFLGWFLGR